MLLTSGSALLPTFSRGVEEAGGAASRVTGSGAGSGLPSDKQRTGNNCIPKVARTICRARGRTRSPGLAGDSALNAQVCPDVFPSCKVALRNSEHHLLCTFIYMPKSQLKRKLLQHAEFMPLIRTANRTPRQIFTLPASWWKRLNGDRSITSC